MAPSNLVALVKIKWPNLFYFLCFRPWFKTLLLVDHLKGELQFFTLFKIIWFSYRNSSKYLKVKRAKSTNFPIGIPQNIWMSKGRNQLILLSEFSKIFEGQMGEINWFSYRNSSKFLKNAFALLTIVSRHTILCTSRVLQVK